MKEITDDEIRKLIHELMPKCTLDGKHFDVHQYTKMVVEWCMNRD